jgi:membrane protein YqaA with SNARE-associated domain
VNSTFSSLLGYFLSPAGLVILGALDSSLIFFLPLGIDFVLVLLAARTPDMFWAYALAATAGSALGASVTYWIGHRVGEKGLSRWIGSSRLARIRRRLDGKATSGLAFAGALPPPFPFTAFVLVGGAVALDPLRFLGAIAAVRAARFGGEAALAARFGEGIARWMDSTAFEIVVALLVVVALIGTTVSAVRVVRSGR